MLGPPAFWRFQILYSFEEMFGGEFRCYGKHGPTDPGQFVRGGNDHTSRAALPLLVICFPRLDPSRLTGHRRQDLDNYRP
jgi:hypothetical protein